MREVRLDEVLARVGGLPVPVACWLLARAAHAMATRPRLLTPDAVRIRDDGGVRVLEPEEPIPPFAYRAPEVVRGEEQTARSAVFGLGVILVESLTGRAPFARGSDMETRIAVTEEAIPPLLGRVAQASPGLDAVVQKALAKAPADRYASTVELGEALDAFLEDELHEIGPEDVRAVIAPEVPAPRAATPAREAAPRAPATEPAPEPAKKKARPARPADGLRAPVSAPPERVGLRRAAEPEPLPPAVSIPPLDRLPAAEPRASARAIPAEEVAVPDLEIPSLVPNAAPTPLEADAVLDVLSDRGPRRRPIDAPLELDEGALAASRPDLPRTSAPADAPRGEPDDFGTGWIKKVGLVLLALLALAIVYQFVVRPLLS